jgi:beta-N-acetylhexosaminidase
MRAPRLAIPLACLVLAALAGVPETAPARADVETDAAESAWIEQTLASMTLPEKVGQLFIPRIYGTTATATDPAVVAQNRAEFGVTNAIDLVNTYHPGGLIYFGANITTPKALADFGNAVQQAAAAQRVPVPVMTSIDQEQGLVVRVGPPATTFPGSMALGASRSTRDAWIAAHITGTELRAMGIFQDNAPDADVNVNPANPVIGVRSFGSRASLVSPMVAAQVDGYQASNVAATAKHFPGHGDTGVDSHTGLPVIRHTVDQLERIDFPPFRAAIAAGVDSIMTAHIVVPSLDPSGDPATLSAPIITGVLREELGFTGVIVTDSLRMQGVRTEYGDDTVAVRASLAGADQLLDPPNLPLAYNAVISAVQSGRITTDRIDQSVRRILAVKWARGLVGPGAALVNTDLIDAIVGAPVHLATAQAISDRTTTLITDSARLIPVGHVAGRAILVTGRGTTTTGAMAEALRGRGAVVTVVETGTQPTPTQVAQAVNAGVGKDLVVDITYNASTYPEQQALANQLALARLPLVVLATGTPYDIAYLTGIRTYVASYSSRPVALESATRVITGQNAATGLLPVTILRADDPTRVLYPFGWGWDYWN